MELCTDEGAKGQKQGFCDSQQQLNKSIFKAAIYHFITAQMSTSLVSLSAYLGLKVTPASTVK